MDATIVFQKNWDAIHKVCNTCNGVGLIDNLSCTHCGDGQTKTKGSGRHYRYIIDEGSSRSSKTYSLIDVYDLYAKSNMNKRLTVWRDTKIDCKKTVLTDTLKHFKKTNRYKKGHDFNKTESILTYATGSTFEIHGTDDEETVHGLTQDAAWLNEPYKISKDTFDQIDQRTSDFIILDWNPKKAHWIDDLKKDPRTIVIHSTFADNPFCPPEQRTKILSYQPISMCRAVTEKLLTEQEARAYDYNTNAKNLSKGRVNELIRCRENEDKKSANEFKWSVYGLGLKAERPNRIFKFNEIPLNQYQAITATEYVGCDWGTVDPWGIIKVKYYDGALYVHEVNYSSENEWRAKLTNTEKAQIASQDEGLVSWLFKKLDISYNTTIVCDNNRTTKILALRNAGWEYAVEAYKPPGSIIDGIDLLNNLTVYYTSCSENFKYEQENYSRKIDRSGQVLEEPEDVDNHTMDPLRYIALHLFREGILTVS